MDVFKFGNSMEKCGCVDYKLLTRQNIARLDPPYSRDISTGNLTAPHFVFDENCSQIYIECDKNIGEKRELLRTNWPEGEIIYAIDVTGRLQTSILWFNVKCDKKTHQWKYSDVENDKEIVTESVACYSV